MKTFFLFLLSFVFLFSCEKDRILTPLKKQLIGAWEFEHVVGYPFTAPYYPPGNGKIIVFFENGNFEKRQHDTTLSKGKYFLSVKKDCYPRESKIFINTNDALNSLHYYINIDSNKLMLSTPNCYADVGMSLYRRI
jgi:hypothetical protein